MKRILVFVLTVLLVLGLAGCTDKAPTLTTSPNVVKETVVTKETVVVKETVEVKVVIAATPEPTKQAELKPTATVVQTAAGAVFTVTNVITQGDWMITYYLSATEEMLNWKFAGIDPLIWPEFPNVTNTVFTTAGVVITYPASQGLEYGMAESIFCQQDQECDFPVAAMHYRIISGDYNISGVDDKCSGDEGNGCAIMIINVGRVTSIFRGQMVDVGFTVSGRYWDGRFLPQAIWAGLSHVAYNMLNLSNDSVNAGANCSVPEGCQKLRLVFVIVSGNEVLMKGVALVPEPVG